MNTLNTMKSEKRKSPLRNLQGVLRDIYCNSCQTGILSSIGPIEPPLSLYVGGGERGSGVEGGVEGGREEGGYYV